MSAVPWHRDDHDATDGLGQAVEASGTGGSVAADKVLLRYADEF
jgi:hypothetical protein